jgi:hypothetical protein
MSNLGFSMTDGRDAKKDINGVVEKGSLGISHINCCNSRRWSDRCRDEILLPFSAYIL